MRHGFADRHEGGRVLADRLRDYSNRDDVIVLALPRGGVPVAFEVAQALRAPLNVFLVRKLGVPNREELAMGAIAVGGVRVLNQEIIGSLGIPMSVVDQVTAAELKELERREREYRDDQPPPDVKGKTVILVDDGLATGSSMRAAAQALKLLDPARIVVAVPTAPRQACEELSAEVDQVVCAFMPEPFYGVGQWYREFAQTTDEQVVDLLRRGTANLNARHPAAGN